MNPEDGINPGDKINQVKNKEIGSEIIFYEKVDSTNIKAKELARNGCKPGTVVLAEEQSTGRGRMGRNWYSPRGTGLWFSIVIYPEILPGKSPFLTILTSLAVFESLQAIEQDLTSKTRIDSGGIQNNKMNREESALSIKWPNDILLNGKKVAGILSETSVSHRIKYAVIGIGINVNQEYFPVELEQKATSLKLYYKEEINRELLLEKLLSSFEKYYYFLLNNRERHLLDMWKERLNIIGKVVKILSGKKVYKGKVIGISDRGELILHDFKDGIKKFWVGDVSLR